MKESFIKVFFLLHFWPASTVRSRCLVEKHYSSAVNYSIDYFRQDGGIFSFFCSPQFQHKYWLDGSCWDPCLSLRTRTIHHQPFDKWTSHPSAVAAGEIPLCSYHWFLQVICFEIRISPCLLGKINIQIMIMYHVLRYENFSLLAW